MYIDDFKITLELQNYFEHITESSKVLLNEIKKDGQGDVISALCGSSLIKKDNSGDLHRFMDVIRSSSLIKDVIKDNRGFYTFTISDEGDVHASKNTLFDFEYRLVISVYCSDEEVDKIASQLSNSCKAGKQSLIDTVNLINTQYTVWVQSVGNYFKEYDFSYFINPYAMLEYLLSLGKREKLIKFVLEYIAELSKEQMKEKCLFRKFLVYSKINILRELVGVLLEKNE